MLTTTKFIINPTGDAPRTIHLKGRERWAMRRLIEAGATGCSTHNSPAPRLSAYIHRLRKSGVEIATVHERHTGAFPGCYGRYILRDDVQELAQ
ncbi:MAG: hypothetical protein CR958_00100 [Rhodobacterales bacterium]|nr:MAG: hypothetical protein CR958_00100 [Rhodobacterales bacterium]